MKLQSCQQVQTTFWYRMSQRYLLTCRSMKHETYGLNITKSYLLKLLSLATKDQLFQYDKKLYKQTDGVGMGSPLGPLMASIFLSSRRTP